MASSWGVDTKDFDTSIRPQDDFYHYACGGWQKKNPIPPSESRWGSFNILRLETDKKVKKILEEVSKKKGLKKGSPEQMIRDLYISGTNLKLRNKLDITPLTPLLEKVEKIKSEKDLQKIVTELHEIGVGAYWNTLIDQDAKISSRYALHLLQDGLGLPDRDYYLKSDKESLRVRKAYQAYQINLFKLLGYSPKLSKAYATRVYAIEEKLARASMRKEDARDAEKTYNKKTLKQLQTLAPAISWKEYLKETGAGKEKTVIVMSPAFLTQVSKLFSSVPLEDHKLYLSFHLVNDFAGSLSERFIDTQFSFYGKVMLGQKELRPLWRRVLGTVNGALGEALGQLFVKKHFPPEAKKKMDDVVNDLFEAYEARLKNLSWMTPKTKKKAIEKLHALNRKIGYPSKWKSYKGLLITPDDYVGNIMRSSRYEHAREMKKLGKPIDRTEWFMTPQTVNAYCCFGLNDITFPAGILQPPFFSLTADDAVNYGAIGAVIGHEITHAFDDQGSKFDKEGNLKNWWTKEDRTRFMKLATIIKKQYDAYEVADGVRVNGQLTLGENIADHGGMAIALDAYHLRLKKTGRKNVDGFTPEQRFFHGFALFEQENASKEHEKMQVLTDPHSPGIFRINGPLSNLDAFYESYNVSPKDKMYRNPSIRTTVW